MTKHGKKCGCKAQYKLLPRQLFHPKEWKCCSCGEVLKCGYGYYANLKYNPNTKQNEQ